MPILGSMKEVLDLTKAGRIGESAALIQQILRGNHPAEAETPIEATRSAAAAGMPKLTFDNRLAEPAAGVARGKARPAKGFTERAYSGEEGRIAYRLFVPAGMVEPAPLLVMLHGCTQSAEDFARGTRMNELAAEMGFIVAYPEQTHAANSQKCWNWFRPGDQERGRGEPALIAALTREIIASHRVDRERVYVAGLSAGGAAAAIMAAAYPDVYAAVGIHSGLACGSARDLPSAFAAMKGPVPQPRPARRPGRYVPTITFHGDKDITVHPSNSEAILASAAADPSLARFERRIVKGKSPGGRKFERTILVDPEGRSWIEHWELRGGGHAWSGGDLAGSYTDPSGPDASRAMLDFFLQHRLSET